MAQTGDILRFGEFTLDIGDRRLMRGGLPVELGSRYFNALVLLVRADGALVSKDRFMDEVWRGVPVTDEALTQCIRTLRRALGDDASAPRFIATVPKHGYRFLAPVTETGDASQPIAEPGSVRIGARFGARIAGAVTVGGGIAGALGGLFYGVVATTGGSASVLTLVALVAMLGILAGAGIGVAVGLAALRDGAGWRAWTSAAALGGAIVGSLGQVLAREGVASLTGAAIGPVTGILEGLVLGAAAGLAGFLSADRAMSVARTVGSAALIGGLAGGFIALVGGRILGVSLLTLQAHFPASQLNLGATGALFGESGFLAVTRVATSIVEAAVFVVAVALAIRLAHRP